MVAYQRTPLNRNRLFFFTRRLSADSQVEVKVGDITQPETVIVHAWKKLGFRVFDLAELFGVEVGKVGEMLAKSVGSRIYQGDVLANHRQWWGLKEKIFRSPMTGVVMDYNSENGKLTLQYLPEEQKLTSGVYGRVVRIIPGGKITIGTRANIVNGVAGFGTRREGSLVEIGYPDIPIQSDQVSSKHANKIIFGGTKISLNAIYKSLSIGVQAVVTGGMDYEDFLRLTGSRGRAEDIGISIFLTEGFGSLPIYPPVYEFLKENEHRHTFFIPGKDRLVIPVSSEAFSAEEMPEYRDPSRVKAPRLKREFGLVEEGSKVRILSPIRFGAYGIVSGVREDGRILVTLQNGEITAGNGELEIIQDDEYANRQP